MKGMGPEHRPAPKSATETHPAGLLDRIAEHPPPGPFRRSFWRSPLRGPWLTAVLGLTLLFGITVVFVTGLLDYAAYNPRFGGAGNQETPGAGLLGFYLFNWPTHPYWLFRLTQGVHVTLGLVLVPVLLAKLWSVIPKLFDWPPVRSPAQLLERISLLLLVGGAGFEFVTGILNIQLFYVFPGSFYTLHLYGAWVFMAAFAVHVALKLPRMIAGLRSRRLREVLRTDTAGTEPEPVDPHGLAPTHPAAPTISRRGALGLVGAGSLTLLVLAAGQSLGGVLRRTALLAPHGQEPGRGPNGFQVNKSARSVGVRPEQTGAAWRLELIGGGTPLQLSRADLLAMPQHRAHLPIACVEGWSTDNQGWTGVQMAELARLAGVAHPASVVVHSLDRGPFGTVTLAGSQAMDPDTVVALRVNGADLSLDHGFPARVIGPDFPGVHCTKWVTRLTFRPA